MMLPKGNNLHCCEEWDRGRDRRTFSHAAIFMHDVLAASYSPIPTYRPGCDRGV